jgi:hypothetical protein
MSCSLRSGPAPDGAGTIQVASATVPMAPYPLARGFSRQPPAPDTEGAGCLCYRGSGGVVCCLPKCGFRRFGERHGIGRLAYDPAVFGYYHLAARRDAPTFAALKGYLTRPWTETAKGFLAADPVCADCGRERSAIAHHLYGLRPHSRGGMDPANLVPVCRSCHAKRHATRRVG